MKILFLLAGLFLIAKAEPGAEFSKIYGCAKKSADSGKFSACSGIKEERKARKLFVQLNSLAEEPILKSCKAEDKKVFPKDEAPDFCFSAKAAGRRVAGFLFLKNHKVDSLRLF
jgi:hypothetical protein